MLDGSKRIPLSSSSNLRVEVYLIGYKSLGESIVILFIDIGDHSVKYSMVIDCYEYKRKNLTDQILRQNKVSTLSLLCWTHPDLDHSLGLDHIITKYCKDTTKIIIPEHFYNLPDDIVSIRKKREKDAIDKIFNLNRIKKQTIATTSVPSQGNIIIEELCFSSFNKDTKVKIYALTPISSILANHKQEGRRNINKNELSISILIAIDEYHMYFGGDTPNNHLEHINRLYFKNCRFVKIPHHCSYSSNWLIESMDMYDDILDFACTTSYKQHGLPNHDLLEKYEKKFDSVLCTGGIGHNNQDYGIVKFKYDFSQEDLDIDIEVKGNAYKYENQTDNL